MKKLTKKIQLLRPFMSGSCPIAYLARKRFDRVQTKLISSFVCLGYVEGERCFSMLQDCFNVKEVAGLH